MCGSLIVHALKQCKIKPPLPGSRSEFHPIVFSALPPLTLQFPPGREPEILEMGNVSLVPPVRVIVMRALEEC